MLPALLVYERRTLVPMRSPHLTFGNPSGRAPGTPPLSVTSLAPSAIDSLPQTATTAYSFGLATQNIHLYATIFLGKQKGGEKAKEREGSGDENRRSSADGSGLRGRGLAGAGSSDAAAGSGSSCAAGNSGARQVLGGILGQSPETRERPGGIGSSVLVDDHGHPPLAVPSLRAVQPHGLGVSDRDGENRHLARAGRHRLEPGENASDVRNRLAWLVEAGLGNGMVSCPELELNHVANVGLEVVGDVLESIRSISDRHYMDLLGSNGSTHQHRGENRGEMHFEYLRLCKKKFNGRQGE